jgi:ribosome-binding protein aMBF1 (putative translation factor)
MYKIYHIKGLKWGCTKQELKRRLKQQGKTLLDVCEIILESDLDKAAELEKELNIRDGYGWNDSRDYRNIIKRRKCSWTAEDRLRGSIKSGQIALETGQFKVFASLGGKKGGPIAGKIQSQKEYVCDKCGKFGRGNRFVNHIKKCNGSK